MRDCWLNKLIDALKNKKATDENFKALKKETGHIYNDNVVNYLTCRKSFGGR